MSPPLLYFPSPSRSYPLFSFSLCVCASVWTLSWLVFSVTGWLMGLICPTVLCVRQPRRLHWRTWVKGRIIDSDKALPALIAAGELDYLFKVPSLAKREPYQWPPDWPHIVFLRTYTGRKLPSVCIFEMVCMCLLWLWNWTLICAAVEWRGGHASHVRRMSRVNCVKLLKWHIWRECLSVLMQTDSTCHLKGFSGDVMIR